MHEQSLKYHTHGGDFRSDGPEVLDLTTMQKKKAGRCHDRKQSDVHVSPLREEERELVPVLQTTVTFIQMR